MIIITLLAQTKGNFHIKAQQCYLILFRIEIVLSLFYILFCYLLLALLWICFVPLITISIGPEILSEWTTSTTIINTYWVPVVSQAWIKGFCSHHLTAPQAAGTLTIPAWEIHWKNSTVFLHLPPWLKVWPPGKQISLILLWWGCVKEHRWHERRGCQTTTGCQPRCDMGDRGGGWHWVLKDAWRLNQEEQKKAEALSTLWGLEILWGLVLREWRRTERQAWEERGTQGPDGDGAAHTKSQCLHLML